MNGGCKGEPSTGRCWYQSYPRGRSRLQSSVSLIAIGCFRFLVFVQSERCPDFANQGLMRPTTADWRSSTTATRRSPRTPDECSITSCFCPGIRNCRDGLVIECWRFSRMNRNSSYPGDQPPRTIPVSKLSFESRICQPLR